MSKFDFIKNKISLFKKDNQESLNDLTESLSDMAEKGITQKKVQVPKSGDFFNISFEAIQEKENRLVIKAHRIKNGIQHIAGSPHEKMYVVEFKDTCAAYLRAEYHPCHYGVNWPYIAWSIRSYRPHPNLPDTRVYVEGFRAREETRKMILAMEQIYGTSNTLNGYVADNKMLFQREVKKGKAPNEIEKAKSNGLMESLGYHHCEIRDESRNEPWEYPKAHWCKKSSDLLGW